jgi:hypothetical protein
MGMSNRLSRLTTPLTGVLFVGLGLATIFLGSNNTPDSSWSGARVIAFYEVHRHDQRISDVLGAVAFMFLVFFAASLRGYLRRANAAEGASTLALAGAALFAVGFVISVGFDYALADVPGRLAPAAAQALNVASNDVWFLVPVGGCVFSIGNGVAILRGAPLPNWLGWVAIVIGIAAFTPALFFALFALLVWVLVVSVLIYLRSGSATPAVAPAAA